MSILFIDQVDITPVTSDVGTRSETEGADVSSVAYVEFENKIIYTSQGQPVRAISFFMLPSGTDIKYGDYITITAMRGRTPTTEESVRRKVTGVFPVAGLGKESHLEVIVSGGSRG